MSADHEQTRELVQRDTLHPRRIRRLQQAEFAALSIGIAAALLDNAVRESQFFRRPWEFGALCFLAMILLTTALILRYRWSLARSSLLRERRSAFLISALWVSLIVGVIVLGPILPGWSSGATTRWDAFVVISELALVGRTIAGLFHSLQGAAATAFNPALILVGSFAGLIAVGTLLLMLPRARARLPAGPAESAPFVTALFTATSASCVTGLVVEDTATYWSREGQVVILLLFQIGGLGIMTFGAFFGLVAGRDVQLREHATLGSLLESEGLADVRRLLLAIVTLTLIAELLGALCLMTLWPQLPFRERVFQSVFHSVSAFCNAGFALTPNSFVGLSHHWQIWGVAAALIIAGGLGFSVLNDLIRTALRRVRQLCSGEGLLRNRPRTGITLTSRIVLITSASLLLGGTVLIFLLERATADETRDAVPLVDAWFQSVTFRTAGFNTVELGDLHPATKLVAILLMFVGASPGSTGGGIKTVVFAVAVLGMLSLLRGRERVECFGRSLPHVVVQKAMAVMFLSLMTVLGTTILLVLYEVRSQSFLDYLFEAVSAAGTVGVSSSISTTGGEMTWVTHSLSTPSRLVIIAAMFLGRIGPLTVVLALSRRTASVRFDYPEERVVLG